jgi:hypothetical protein
MRCMRAGTRLCVSPGLLCLTRRAVVRSPKLAQKRKQLSEVLHDVVTLEVALSRKTEAHVLVRGLVALAPELRALGHA